MFHKMTFLPFYDSAANYTMREYSMKVAIKYVISRFPGRELDIIKYNIVWYNINESNYPYRLCTNK